MKRTTYLVTVLSADADAPIETFDMADAIERSEGDRPLLFVSVAPSGTTQTVAGADVDVDDDDAVNTWLAAAAVAAGRRREDAIK